MSNPVYLGLDPGVSNGLAVWSRKEKSFLELKTVTFWEAVARIRYYQDIFGADLMVIIEDPSYSRVFATSFALGGRSWRSAEVP